MKKSASTFNQQDTAIPQDIYEELIAWTVKLNSGLAQDEDHAAFGNWRAANPLHEQAWRKLQSIDASFQGISQEAAPAVLDTLDLADKKRKVNLTHRKKIKLLSLGAIAVITGGIFLNSVAPTQQAQSFIAGIGKKETILLADGTKLLLNTNTKVAVKLSLFKREIVMLQGEIYIETGQDKESIIGRRPFWVQTKQAGLEAIGTRFAVKQAEANTRLHVTQGIVAMHVGSDSPVRAYDNETYTITDVDNLPAKTDASTFDPVGWVDNILVAKQMRLEDFAAELSRYRTTPVYCEPSAKDLKVSGVFQLDGPQPIDHALNAIVRTLPVKLIPQTNNSILITSR